MALVVERASLQPEQGAELGAAAVRLLQSRVQDQALDLLEQARQIPVAGPAESEEMARQTRRIAVERIRPGCGAGTVVLGAIGELAPDLGWQVAQTKQPGVGLGHQRAPDKILQLPCVSGQLNTGERLQEVRADAGATVQGEQPMLGDKMRDQRGQVLAPRAQRRQCQHDNV
jgi:hypothetical protein